MVTSVAKTVRVLAAKHNVSINDLARVNPQLNVGGSHACDWVAARLGVDASKVFY